MAKTPMEPLVNFGGRKPLSETELEYMKVIWTHPEGGSSDEIFSRFPGSAGAKGTILFRISEKGYVFAERRGKHYWYIPQTTELEYHQAVMRTKMEKSFGISSMPEFIAAFCGKKKMKKESFERIDAFLEEMMQDE